MDNKLYRKEALEKAATPDKLNEVIKTAKPSMWLVIITVFLVLLGALAWSAIATVDTTVAVAVGEDTAFVKETDIAKVDAGMEIRTESETYAVAEIGAEPVQAESVLSAYELHLFGLNGDDWIYCVKINGTFEKAQVAEIIVDTVHPISFLWN